MRTRSDLLVLLRNKDRYFTKQVRFFFSKLYGIGNRRVLFLLIFIGLNKNYSLKLLKVNKGKEIKYRYMDRLLVKKNILYGRVLRKRRDLINNILRNIFCYRGMRRIYGKPCRGQRTHSNASTAKKFALRMLFKRITKYSKTRKKVFGKNTNINYNNKKFQQRKK